MFEILLAGGRGYYPQSGPGNKIMIDGNIDLGYFGTVSSAELFKSSELLLKTGLPYHTSAAWLYPNWRPVLEYIPEVIAS